MTQNCNNFSLFKKRDMASKCKVAVRILIWISRLFKFTVLSLAVWTEFSVSMQGHKSSGSTKASGVACAQSDQGISPIRYSCLGAHSCFSPHTIDSTHTCVLFISSCHLHSQHQDFTCLHLLLQPVLLGSDCHWYENQAFPPTPKVSCLLFYRI